MTTVYVLFGTDHIEDQILGVYTTQDQAEAAAQAIPLQYEWAAYTIQTRLLDASALHL
jgi:hypothetical protein